MVKRFFKFIGYTLLGIIGLAVIALVALRFISDEQYKAWITGAAKSATGRELSIDGEFEINLGTSLSLLARDVRFANAEWGSRNDMVTVGRLYAQVELLPLFKGVLDMTVETDSPDILLETDADGTPNWVFAQPDATAAEKPQPGKEEGQKSRPLLPIKPYIRNLQVSNLVFAFNDQAGGTQLDAAVETFRIFVDGGQIPLDLAAHFEGAPIVLTGSLGNLDQWFDNEQTPVSLQGRLSEAELEITGTAGPILPQPEANLDIVLSAAKLDTFSPFSQLAGVALPGLEGFSAALNMAAAGGRLSVRDINLALNDPRLKANLTGRAEDLTGAGNLDLKAVIDTDSADELLASLAPQIPYEPPRSVKLKAAVSGHLKALSISDLELLVSDEGLDASLTGGLENLQALQGGSAALELRVDSTSLIGRYIGREVPSFGPFTGSAKLSSSGDRVRLESLVVDLSDPLITAQVNGSAGNIGRGSDSAFTVDDIVVNADVASQNLKGIAEKFGAALPGELPASLTLHGAVAGNLSTLSITDLELIVKDEGLDVSLTGGLENLLAPQGGNVDLELRLDSTALIGGYIGREIPSFGPFTGSAKLSSAGDHIQLESLVVDLSDPLITAQVTGSAGTIAGGGGQKFSVDDIVIHGQAASQNLPGIAEKFGVELPGELPASLALSADAAGNLNELTLETLQAELLDEGVDVQLAAAVQNLIDVKGVEISLSGNLADTARLSKYAGVKVPGLGSLNLQSQVVSTESGYRLDNLELGLDGEQADLQLKASIEDLFKLTGIKVVADGDLATLAALSDLTGAQLPDTGPWNAQITADSENLWERPLIFSAKAGGEGIDATLSGEVSDVRQPQNFQGELEIDVASIADLLAMIGRTVPEDAPLKLTASASGKPGEYRFDRFAVESGDADMEGDFAYLVPPAGGVERNSLTGRLAINNFDVSPLLAAKQQEVQAADEGAPAAASPEAAEDAEAGDDKPVEEGKENTAGQPKKVFSDAPLTAGVLHDYDVDLKIDAANVKIRDDVTLSGNTAVKLDNGQLSIDPFELNQSEGGTGKGYAHLDASGTEAVLDVVLSLDRFVSPLFGGLFDVDMDLDSRGASLASLMGNLNGYFAASLHDVELRKSFMSQFGAGLLNHLNPLDSDTTLLECAVVRFDIKDGIADFEKQIAAQTTEVTWIGGGTVNLKTEEIDVGISPKARGAVSSLTNIDLASLVHIGGTLAEPKIGIDLADVAKKYAGYTAFVATGGLSFLAQKLVETVQANVDQCERILEDLGKD
ncbi:MAG: AsmA family protein [Desulfofustis sp.]|nr:AsmA family protein [Desulfofustis sp.]